MKRTKTKKTCFFTDNNRVANCVCCAISMSELVFGCGFILSRVGGPVRLNHSLWCVLSKRPKHEKEGWVLKSSWSHYKTQSRLLYITTVWEWLLTSFLTGGTLLCWLLCSVNCNSSLGYSCKYDRFHILLLESSPETTGNDDKYTNVT